LVVTSLRVGEEHLMPQNENVLWDVMRLLHGHSVTMGWAREDEEEKPSPIENAFAVGKLKGELVLKHTPADIEDTIYFLKHREYLVTHGMGMVWPEAVYSLTDKAIDVFKRGELPKDEQKAFAEALWEIKPRFYGVGPNLPAMVRWMRRRFGIN
jgi:hypothetical protein